MISPVASTIAQTTRKPRMSPLLNSLHLFIVRFLHWILLLDRPK
jgi:hypothetical protein